MDHQDPTAVRAAFDEATDDFVASLEAVRDHDLSVPATDAWSVLELIAHVTRGVGIIEAVLEAEPCGRTLPDAGTYFRTALSFAGAHAAVAQRGRDAVAALGDDPISTSIERLAAMRALASTVPDDRVVTHAAGDMAFPAYLATRVLELVLHGYDLQLATSQPLRASEQAVRTTLSVLSDIASTEDVTALSASMSGRTGAATVSSVLG